jgi:hypothetical protein
MAKPRVRGAAVARLSSPEFRELIDELVAFEGLARLQEKLVRSHVVVSRRRLGSAESIARQLYQLTLGLDRETLASQVVIALWEEMTNGKLDEEASKELEKIAERINACLDGGEIDATKEVELRSALSDYRTALAAKLGEKAARLTMLSRAFPAVARIIREPAPEAARGA